MLQQNNYAPAPFDGLLRNHYAAVLADPPYHFTTYSAKGQGRAPSAHYHDMTFDEIAALPVGELAARDAWLFLWTPGKHQHHAMALLERWGFEFSGSEFVWAKQTSTGKWHFGLGKTTRKTCEFCFLGRRGQPKILAHNVREFIVAPIREHSRKPDQQYESIEAYAPVPYLELFARQCRAGWVSWGDEVDLFKQKIVS